MRFRDSLQRVLAQKVTVKEGTLQHLKNSFLLYQEKIPGQCNAFVL